MKKSYYLSRIALVCSMGLIFLSLAWMSIKEYENSYEVGSSDVLIMHAYAMKDSLKSALEGDEAAFKKLEKNRNDFQASLSLIDMRENRIFLSSSKTLMLPTIARLEKSWNANEKIVDFCLSNQRKILESYRAAQDLIKDADVLKGKYKSILLDFDKRSDMKLISELTNRQIEALDNFSGAFELSNLSNILIFSAKDPNEYFKDVLGNQTQVNDLLSSVAMNDEMQGALADIRSAVGELSKNLNFLVSTQSLRQYLGETYYTFDGGELLGASVGVFRNYVMASLNTLIGPEFVLFLQFIGFIALLYIVMLERKSDSGMHAELMREREKNTDDIRQLLHEMNAISNGNFNVIVTARDGITKEITLLLNACLMAVRRSMQSIFRLEKEFRMSLEEVQKSIVELDRNNSVQEKEFHSTDDVLKTFEEKTKRAAAEISEIIEGAMGVVSTAEQSVKKVEKNSVGFVAVKDALLGIMNSFDEIVKKSKEIDQCVSLLNDVSDKTTVLALNAAIQASMSTDINAGVSLVASDMQDLSIQTKDTIQRVIRLIHRVVGDMELTHKNMTEILKNIEVDINFPKEIGNVMQSIGYISKKHESLHEKIHSALRSETESCGVLVEKHEKIAKINAETALTISNSRNKCQQLRDVCDRLKVSISHIISSDKEENA